MWSGVVVLVEGWIMGFACQQGGNKCFRYINSWILSELVKAVHKHNFSLAGRALVRRSYMHNDETRPLLPNSKTKFHVEDLCPL